MTDITLKLSREALKEFHDCLLALEPDDGEKYPSWEFLEHVLSGVVNAHGTTVQWDNTAECWQEMTP
jgi:hypothetical protein